MRKRDHQKMELTNSPKENTALKCLLKFVSNFRPYFEWLITSNNH